MDNYRINKVTKKGGWWTVFITIGDKAYHFIGVSLNQIIEYIVRVFNLK